jgi:hypothetical protein
MRFAVRWVQFRVPWVKEKAQRKTLEQDALEDLPSPPRELK